MKLSDLSVLVVFNCFLPLATLIFSLLLKTAIMVLQFARMKISGIVYHAMIVYRKRFLDVVHTKPTAIVSRNIGILCLNSVVFF